MLKRFVEKLRLWGVVLMGIDDLQGDYLLSLEKRITLLEAAVAERKNNSGEGNQRKRDHA